MRRLVPAGARHSEYEACTLLFTGLAPGVRSGDWVMRYGGKGTVPDHVLSCIDTREGEVESSSARLYERCEEQAGAFMLVGDGPEVGRVVNGETRHNATPRHGTNRHNVSITVNQNRISVHP